MSEAAPRQRGRRAVRSGLAEQVADQLLQDVVDGVYPPESRLPPEPVLADQTGVSRLTLREAVKSLGQRGVLRVEQGRGTFVNPQARWLPFDPRLLSTLVRRDHDLALRLTEVRGIVEVGAASLSAKRRTAEALAEMRAALDQARSAHDAQDAEAFSRADIDFHLAVLRSVGNDFVPALLAPVDAGLREVRLQTSQDHAVNERALEMHTMIYQAIRKRASRTAADLMARHLEETREHIAAMP
ncbi:MAG TPA: FCD domain-containing protein [Nocardioidaceae bacterium]|nr:FCD domain-containing protein [Nocardioidaceae bacterium]